MKARRKNAARALVLRLYVAGDSPNSLLARENLRRVIAPLRGGRVDVEIVDVLREPERGLRDRVFVTPTLIRVEPRPERRVIGSLKEAQLVRSGIGLDEVDDG